MKDDYDRVRGYHSRAKVGDFRANDDHVRANGGYCRAEGNIVGQKVITLGQIRYFD